MKEEKITISLKKEEALVLFEFVSKFNKEILWENNNSDVYALWGLENSLEEKLTEPFLENYDEIIIKARKKIEDFHKKE